MPERSKEVRRTLDCLPRALEETYNRILSHVSPADEILLHKVLSWLAFAFSPLTLEELWEAVAVEPGASNIDAKSRLRSPQDLLSLAHSLISVTTTAMFVWHTHPFESTASPSLSGNHEVYRDLHWIRLSHIVD